MPNGPYHSLFSFLTILKNGLNESKARWFGLKRSFFAQNKKGTWKVSRPLKRHATGFGLDRVLYFRVMGRHDEHAYNGFEIEAVLIT